MALGRIRGRPKKLPALKSGASPGRKSFSPAKCHERCARDALPDVECVKNGQLPKLGNKETRKMSIAQGPFA